VLCAEARMILRARQQYEHRRQW